jgi:hypothetical protein
MFLPRMTQTSRFLKSFLIATGLVSATDTLLAQNPSLEEQLQRLEAFDRP